MRFPTLFACAAALLLISVGASHAAAPAITGEMQKKYESMQSFTAEFTQRLVHQESGAGHIARGFHRQNKEEQDHDLRQKHHHRSNSGQNPVGD